MMRHPNRNIAVTVGTVATAIIGTARLFGVEVPAELGTAWATLLIAGALWLGRGRERFGP